MYTKMRNSIYMPSGYPGSLNYYPPSPSSPEDELSNAEFPSLILDGQRIYAAGRPEQPLYELTQTPHTGLSGICSVHRLVYRVTSDYYTGEASIRSRTHHIYDVRAQKDPSTHLWGHIDVVGQLGPEQTYQKVEVLGTSPHWMSCEATNVLKAKHGHNGGSWTRGLHQGKHVAWKDRNGNLIAVEEKPPNSKRSWSQDEDKSLARLDIKCATLDAKDFDFLVTCWVGRVWKVGQMRNTESASWGLVKRKIGQSPWRGKAYTVQDQKSIPEGRESFVSVKRFHS